ncbi:hypothetical protein C5B96_03480 [Subtercola sp. Z020]|uniref:DUF6789 family protein n=1 Tax=Subtercola sp. Z020 TaxID=2080582 RepID=UPI000CE88736|nr:DUF6789 family protein [Subtercola sp. Z020]PPF87857.1 hypothetical protein C5B96_03480 [Subtercola sp. Z020]
MSESTAGRVVRSGVRGIVTGLAATAAMSVVFVGADRAGAVDRPPPRSIVDHFLPFVPPKASDRAAATTHFAYGAAGGVAFELLMHALHEPRLGRRLASGAAFGLAVWAAGYEGWVPAMNVLPPAHRDHPARVASELAAHLVYGLSLGAFGHLLHRRAARAGAARLDTANPSAARLAPRRREPVRRELERREPGRRELERRAAQRHSPQRRD